MSEAGPIRAEKLRTAQDWDERVEGRFSFPIESAMATPLDGDGAPMGALGVFSKLEKRAFEDQDMSLLELVAANISTAVRLFRASSARERSERLTSIGRLLSQVIHDFKTPMTVISGYVQVMATADDKTEREDHARRILKQFDVITSMQREVLEFARGDRNIFIRKVYLSKFFNDIRAQLGQELDGRAIDLEMDIDTKIVARFDEGRMARAIHNLVRNALEAMAERGGKLTIRAREDKGDVVISVIDTGPGIPKEVEGRLFQSFVTSGKKGGTGLGLAIVKKIVEEHGGTVAVHSGEAGTTFELRIPQKGPPGRSDQPPPDTGRAPSPATPRRERGRRPTRKTTVSKNQE